MARNAIETNPGDISCGLLYLYADFFPWTESSFIDAIVPTGIAVDRLWALSIQFNYARFGVSYETNALCSNGFLGLTLHSLNLFAMGYDGWGAVFFVLSLCFKQMALYYAPAIGTYLLAKCLYLGRPEG